MRTKQAAARHIEGAVAKNSGKRASRRNYRLDSCPNTRGNRRVRAKLNRPRPFENHPRTQRMRPEARRRSPSNAPAANGANRAPMQTCRHRAGDARAGCARRASDRRAARRYQDRPSQKGRPLRRRRANRNKAFYKGALIWERSKDFKMPYARF